MDIQTSSFQASISLYKLLFTKSSLKFVHIEYHILWFFQYRFSTKLDKFLISISILASLVAGVTLPYAITLVAGVFQNMITYDKAVQAGTQDDEAFLSKMHKFGVTYSCVGVLLFVCVYLGSALMNVTAINQVK